MYYTTLAKDEEISSEMKYFNKLVRSFKGVVHMNVFRMDQGKDDFTATAKKFKVGGLNKNKPKLRYYPN